MTLLRARHEYTKQSVSKRRPWNHRQAASPMTSPTHKTSDFLKLTSVGRTRTVQSPNGINTHIHTRLSELDASIKYQMVRQAIKCYWSKGTPTPSSRVCWGLMSSKSTFSPETLTKLISIWAPWTSSDLLNWIGLVFNSGSRTEAVVFFFLWSQHKCTAHPVKLQTGNAYSRYEGLLLGRPVLSKLGNQLKSDKRQPWRPWQWAMQRRMWWVQKIRHRLRVKTIVIGGDIHLMKGGKNTV